MDQLNGVLQFSNRWKLDIQSLRIDRLLLHISYYIANEQILIEIGHKTIHLSVGKYQDIRIDRKINLSLDRPLQLYLNYLLEVMSLRHHLTLPQHLAATTNPTTPASNSNNVNLPNNTSESSRNRLTFSLVQEGVAITVGILAVVALIIFILVTIYRRYRAKQDYNDSPQNFAHRPDLSWREEYLLHHTPMEAAVSPEKIKITKQNNLNGESYQLEFTGQDTSVAYFHRRQQTTCYFQIQVLKLNSIVEIGFVPVEMFNKIKENEESIGSSGVGVTTTGFVQADGENIYNYSWILAYGDIVGIGLSENSKLKQRRAWISKNGVLLNSPPMDEMDKWIATVEIGADQKQEYNLGKQEPQKAGNHKQEQKEQTEKVKQQRERKQAQLKKQRISLKFFKQFQYYPVIMCHGHKNEKQSTVINVNVGGQIFRMYDTFFVKGLLNNKSLFGNNE